MKILFLAALALFPGLAAADPISIVAGISSIAAAGGTAAIGATLAGTASFLTGLQVVGGVMSIAGGITKNKKLQKIGGIASLAGGVGKLAQSMFSTAADAVGSSASLGSGADAISAADEIYQGAGGFADAGSQAGNAMSMADEVYQGANVGSNFAENVASNTSSLAPQTTSAAEAMRPVASSNFGPGMSGAETGGYDAGMSRADQLVKAQTSGGSTFDKILKAMKDNPEATRLGGGLISGAMKYLGASEAAQAEQEAADRRRQEYSRSLDNIYIPSRVNPNANITRGVQPQNPMRYIPQRG